MGGIRVWYCQGYCCHCSVLVTFDEENTRGTFHVNLTNLRRAPSSIFFFFSEEVGIDEIRKSWNFVRDSPFRFLEGAFTNLGCFIAKMTVKHNFQCLRALKIRTWPPMNYFDVQLECAKQADCNGSDNELSEQSYVQSRSMRDRPVRHFAHCYSLGFWAKFQIQYKMSTTDTYHEGRAHEFYCQFKCSAQGQVYKLLALACLTSFPELKVAW